MQRDDRAYLWDIIDACSAIESLLADVEANDYVASRLLRSAVEREFITIGEATAALSRAAPALFSRLTAGRRIVDFRNQLTHEYRHTDDQVVWLVARNEVPVLRRECEALLAEAGDAD
jgi:uncharacterized protein with HEPN domain